MAGVAAWSLACVAPAGSPEAAPKPPPFPVVRLSGVGQVGPYLDATLHEPTPSGEPRVRRFFFPRSADCQALLVEGAERLYVTKGAFGRLRGDDGARCEPLGVASLAEWRDSLPRRRSQYLVPRVQAAFAPLPGTPAPGPEGGGLLLVRGRFPLALEIRWPEPMDSVAVLPDRPACRALLAADTATMAFHAKGPDVFVLEGEGGPCPIVGLAIPLEVD